MRISWTFLWFLRECRGYEKKDKRHKPLKVNVKPSDLPKEEKQRVLFESLQTLLDSALNNSEEAQENSGEL